MYFIVGGDQKEYGPVSAEQVRQWIAEGRANGRTLAKTEGGPWKPLSTFPEFADTASAAAPPPAGSAPPPVGGQPTAGSMPAIDAKALVNGPAIFLIVVGAIGAALSVFGLLSHAFGWAMMPQPEATGNPALDQFIEMASGGLGIVANLFSIVMGAFIIYGATCLLKLRYYGLCIATAIVALLPCVSPCCCLGLPAGIWALVVLAKPEVKAAFQSTAR